MQLDMATGASLRCVAIACDAADTADELLDLLQAQKRQTVFKKLVGGYKYGIFRIKDGSGLLLLAEATGTRNLFNMQQLPQQLADALGDYRLYFKPCHVKTGQCDDPACSKQHRRFTDAGDAFSKLGGERKLEFLLAQPSDFANQFQPKPEQLTLLSDPLWKTIFLPLGTHVHDIADPPERRRFDVQADAEAHEIRQLARECAVLQAREQVRQTLADREYEAAQQAAEKEYERRRAPAHAAVVAAENDLAKARFERDKAGKAGGRAAWDAANAEVQRLKAVLGEAKAVLNRITVVHPQRTQPRVPTPARLALNAALETSSANLRQGQQELKMCLRTYEESGIITPELQRLKYQVAGLQVRQELRDIVNEDAEHRHEPYFAETLRRAVAFAVQEQLDLEQPDLEEPDPERLRGTVDRFLSRRVTLATNSGARFAVPLPLAPKGLPGNELGIDIWTVPDDGSAPELLPAGSMPASEWLPAVLLWRFGEHGAATPFPADARPADWGLNVPPVAHPKECLAAFLACSPYDGHVPPCNGQCRLFFAWAVRHNAVLEEVTTTTVNTDHGTVKTETQDPAKSLQACGPCSCCGHPTAPAQTTHLGRTCCATCACILHAVCANPAGYCPACGEQRIKGLQAQLVETDHEIARLHREIARLERETARLERKRKRQADDIERFNKQMKK